ncbi:hypothetical protein C8J56DRAFT_1046427 [Mycena floridula]|nr:hypothetical protein C8J56DRAFT_1046427 [Mycena floridula]
MTLSAAVRSLDYERALTILCASNSDNFDTNVDELAETYVAACKADPARTSEYTSFVFSLHSSDHLPTIGIHHPYANTIEQQPLDYLIRYSIFDTIRDLLADDEDHEISPENPYLIAAIVSGSCIGTTLCDCSDQTGNINEGLQLVPYCVRGVPGEKEKEIRAIHACLQALLAGKEYQRHADVAEAVRKLKKNGVITSELGKKLIDFTLVHAQENRPSLSSDEAWRILFP